MLVFSTSMSKYKNSAELAELYALHFSGRAAAPLNELPLLVINHQVRFYHTLLWDQVLFTTIN